ncbi:glia maturation factor gamma-like [Antedon mediterranea]|uniref:glia maturation factor gamma-like n=1 Tax=Antedon mediterranea TaxID=105859 RepID=UPI003AF7055C
MSSELKVCEIDSELLENVKTLRLKKNPNNECMILKIEVGTQTVKIDETFEDVLPEDIQEELPAHQPRYVVYSYKLKHDDGRISYPFIFIFISPSGGKPELQMMYAGSKLSIVNACGFTKVFELRSVEEFTEEWLKKKLSFFR